MALNSINTNIAAYFAQQNIGTANSMTSGSIGRLSSGNRIVRASDDVAAMSVGTSLRTQVTTLKMGLLNANQGSSMLQVADGALSKIQDMLLRQKSLATQATSGSLTSAERGFLNQEFQNLTAEIDRLTQNTNFNGVNLLGGGLGTSASVVRTDALAISVTDVGAATNTAYSTASTLAIEAIDRTTGAGVGAAAGNIALTRSDGTTALADEEFLNVNGAVYGSIEKFEFSNVVYGTSATLTVTMNGVKFTGTVADGEGAAAGEIILSNGTTNLSLQASAALALTDEASVQSGLAQLYVDFADTVMMSARVVGGVSFQGTALDGALGSATTGVASIRIADASNVDIGNFKYVSNAGTGAHILTVEVNGETWTASGVADVIDEDVLIFEKGNGEFLRIDLTGQTEAIGVAGTNDLLTNPELRTQFVNALNIGFGRAGGGVDFALGTERTDSLRVQISNASSSALYNGQSLNVTTVADAQAAGDALNVAIANVTSIRADVGAMMSRFDFASANIEISLQNQDAARGTLLDTDIASESSAYATAQVQLQAGIAVLAQANLLPQNLLKLIG